MGKFDLNDLLNSASTAAAAPRPGMHVVMLPRDQLVANPENKIYIIGNVDQLAEDIASNGIRQPLEVIPTQDGKYMLISGHRRLAACAQLDALGNQRFSHLPCVIKASKGTAEDTLDLITANATARELTDGERLDQYQAMKAALEQLKKEGKLEGRVRDEMSRRLGESTGTLARLNAIAANAVEEVKQMLRDGKCGLVRAYEASKQHPREQVYYAEHGTPPVTPQLDEGQLEAVTHWILYDSPAVEYLRQWDYLSGSASMFMQDCQDHKLRGFVDVPNGLIARVSEPGEPMKGAYIIVNVVDPADDDYQVAAQTISWSALYLTAKELYGKDPDPAELERMKKEKQAQKENRQREDLAYDLMHHPQKWPLGGTDLGYGLTLYVWPLSDGTELQALCADRDDSMLVTELYRRINPETNEMLSLGQDIGWAEGLNYYASTELLGEFLEALGEKGGECDEDSL